jgi:ribonuclease HII
MIGIDEVGRGCWAGPLLVVAARDSGVLPKGLDDSKKLSKKRREALFNDITLACDVGEGWITAKEIDAIGITNAMRLGVKRALMAINAQSSEVIIMDGNINYCAPDFTNVSCVVKGDSEYPVVSAASIYAKVLRDKAMADNALLFPGYGFELHVGYGTAMHAKALASLGVTTLHRLSYKPVKAFVV